MGLDFLLYIMHVLVGNFDLYECCHLHGQTVRRMRDQQFARYHLDNQKECEEFVGALKSLLERVPLTVDVPAFLTRWRWFGEWSLGCVGILGDWIVDTVDATLRAGGTVLTVEALTKHALQPDQRARLSSHAVEYSAIRTTTHERHGPCKPNHDGSREALDGSLSKARKSETR